MQSFRSMFTTMKSKPYESEPLNVKRQITIGSNDKLIFYDLSFVTTD